MTFATVRELPRSGQAMLVALGLIPLGIAAGGHATVYAAVPVLLILLVRLAERVLARWTLLFCGAIVVDLVIPEDGRYTLGGGAGFQLEPYRVAIGILIVGWLVALLVDPRVRWRSTRFEKPLFLIVFAIIGSELLNTDRIVGVGSFVIKTLSLFLCFVLLLYMVVSLVRKRETVHLVLKVLVTAGCVEAIGGFIQRGNGFNIFDHLHRFIPIFSFNSGAALASLNRNGGLRAEASAGHPIEFSTVTTMLVPIAIYLAIAHRQRRWWAAVAVLEVGSLSSGSKTGFLELVGVVLIFIWLRPRQTVKCWPALIPIVIVMSVLVPHSLSGIWQGFFPKGGFIKDQSQVFHGRTGAQDVSRLSRIGPQIHGVFLKHNPLFGEGYGTRITGRTSLTGAVAEIPAQNVGQVLDDQWFGTLLDTGILGVLGWLLMFFAVVRRLGRRARLERDHPEGWLPVALAASIFSFAIGMFTYDAFTFIQAVVILYVMIGLASVVLWLPPIGTPRALRRRQPRAHGPTPGVSLAGVG